PGFIPDPEDSGSLPRGRRGLLDPAGAQQAGQPPVGGQRSRARDQPAPERPARHRPPQVLAGLLVAPGAQAQEREVELQRRRPARGPALERLALAELAALDATHDREVVAIALLVAA